MEAAARRMYPQISVLDPEVEESPQIRAADVVNSPEVAHATDPDHTPQLFAVSAELMGVSLSSIGWFAILSHFKSVATFAE